MPAPAPPAAHMQLAAAWLCQAQALRSGAGLRQTSAQRGRAQHGCVQRGRAQHGCVQRDCAQWDCAQRSCARQ